MSKGTGIDGMRLANAQAELEKVKKRHRKLQRDVSKFINLLAHTDYITVDIGSAPNVENHLASLFDKIREGKI
jgi:hypothetical protein